VIRHRKLTARGHIEPDGRSRASHGLRWKEQRDRCSLANSALRSNRTANLCEMTMPINVWDYLRQNKLCARVWDTYDDIVEACRQAWNFLIDDPERIRSIGSREWACVTL